MSGSLQSAAAVNQDALVTVLVAVIDAEVADQKGLSGAAIKAGYAAVQKAKPGAVRNATSAMLPQFMTALAPFWDSKPSGSSFGEHLASHSDAAAEALLSVSDAQTGSANPALTKIYKSLRGTAKTYVIAALPRVGDAIEKHADASPA